MVRLFEPAVETPAGNRLSGPGEGCVGMNRTFVSALAAAVALGGSVILTANALAETCYTVDYGDRRDSHERLVLDIKRHSPLGSGQVADSVHGKYVASCGRGGSDMVTATGTVVTFSSGRRGDDGARLGVETQGALNNCKNTTFDCTAEDGSAATSRMGATCAVRADGDRGARRASLGNRRQAR